jgi:hypothetical protein
MEKDVSRSSTKRQCVCNWECCELVREKLGSEDAFAEHVWNGPMFGVLSATGIKGKALRQAIIHHLKVPQERWKFKRFNVARHHFSQHLLNEIGLTAQRSTPLTSAQARQIDKLSGYSRQQESINTIQSMMRKYGEPLSDESIATFSGKFVQAPVVSEHEAKLAVNLIGSGRSNRVSTTGNIRSPVKEDIEVPEPLVRPPDPSEAPALDPSAESEIDSRGYDTDSSGIGSDNEIYGQEESQGFALGFSSLPNKKRAREEPDGEIQAEGRSSAALWQLQTDEQFPIYPFSAATVSDAIEYLKQKFSSVNHLGNFSIDPNVKRVLQLAYSHRIKEEQGPK